MSIMLTAATPEPSKYPVAAPMMQPTNKPMITLADFMIGEPNRSVRRIVRNTENPRPMYCADPHGRAWTAVILGHLAKNSVGFKSEQGPDPPAHPLKPEPMSSTPMSMTVGPVTIGGKIFCKTFGGRKESAISTSEQHAAVPKRAP
jgi:hypothetical protein